MLYLRVTNQLYVQIRFERRKIIFVFESEGSVGILGPLDRY
jgi:hypothetical protein